MSVHSTAISYHEKLLKSSQMLHKKKYWRGVDFGDWRFLDTDAKHFFHVGFGTCPETPAHGMSTDVSHCPRKSERSPTSDSVRLSNAGRR